MFNNLYNVGIHTQFYFLGIHNSKYYQCTSKCKIQIDKQYVFNNCKQKTLIKYLVQNKIIVPKMLKI